MISWGDLAFLNKILVALFTELSVVCADKTTAIKKVNLFI